MQRGRIARSDAVAPRAAHMCMEPPTPLDAPSLLPISSAMTCHRAAAGARAVARQRRAARGTRRCAAAAVHRHPAKLPGRCSAPGACDTARAWALHVALHPLLRLLLMMRLLLPLHLQRRKHSASGAGAATAGSHLLDRAAAGQVLAVVPGG